MSEGKEKPRTYQSFLVSCQNKTRTARAHFRLFLSLEIVKKIFNDHFPSLEWLQTFILFFSLPVLRHTP